MGLTESYNNVEITPDERASLDEKETTASQATDVATQQTEATSQEATESPDVEGSGDVQFEEVVLEPKIEIDGELYNADQAKEWMVDSKNKSEWQKSNTEKSQSLSKMNKLAKKISTDSEFKSHIKDYFYENPDEFNSLGLDEMAVLESEVPELKSIDESLNDEGKTAIEQRLDRLESSENERIDEQRVEILDSNLTILERDNPDLLGTPEQVSEFLEFCEINSKAYTDGDGLPDMGQMFKEWSYDFKMSELEHYKKLDKNKERNYGKVIGKSQMGAKETTVPKKYKSFKEMSVKDPDIAKYFNE